MPVDANLEHYSYYYESQDGDRYDVISSGSYHGLEIILDENEELEDLVLTLKQESKLVTYHIIVNGNSLYSKELPYGSTIRASDIEENGVRKILFVINKTDEITYELTNGDNGYNTRENRPMKTTYLVGPDYVPPIDPVDPPVDPVDPVDPVTPDKVIIDDNNENLRVLKGFERPEAIDKVQPYTPVAYAADLDDEDVYAPVRKNVDGSVTVVRAFPMVN